MRTSLYESVEVVVTVEWAYVLCGCLIQNDRVSNKTASNFALSLKLFGWSRRPQAWAMVIDSFITTTYPLMHHVSCIASHAVFLVTYQITHVTQPHYRADFTPWDFRLFSKLKTPLKGKKFQTVWIRFRKIQQSSWWWLGELCEVPRCPL